MTTTATAAVWRVDYSRPGWTDPRHQHHDVQEQEATDA